MYDNRYIFKYFVKFIEKRGRARGVSLNQMISLYKIWHPAFNSGKSAEMVRGKKRINEQIDLFFKNRRSYSPEEFAFFNEFLTRPEDYFTEFSQSIKIDTLTEFYPQLLLNL